MQASVNREGDVVVVQLSGRVDVETAEPFREACLKKLAGQKVVFDFQRLGFVGSSGILPFLETMQRFVEAHPENLKFSNVGSEFRKVFAATPLNIVKVYETSQAAALSYANPQIMAIELVPLNEQTPVSASAPQGYLAFSSAQDETGGIATESYDEDSDETALG
jgi:anti-anti-sigma factor